MGTSAHAGLTGRTLRAPTRAARDVERQFGAIARRQLLRHGFSRGRIRHWLRRGRLHPLYPGVYAWGRPDLPVEGQLIAALLFAGHGSALGGISALWWRGLLNRRPDRIHVDAPGRRGSTAEIAIRHPGHLPSGAEVARLLHRGVPTVPLPQALLAAARQLSRDSLRLVLARAEFHRVLALEEVEAALGPGREGSRALRAALDAHLPQLAACENGLERAFVLLCERHRLPIPEPNPRLGRRRPDMLWREQMAIVELDGGRAHSTAAQQESDGRRQAQLEARGFALLRFGPGEVRGRPARVAASTRELLGRTRH